MSKKIKVGYLLLQKHDGAGGLENVLLKVFNKLKLDSNIEQFVYFLEEPKKYEFVNEFDNSFLYRIPRLIRNKHFFRPKIIYYLFLYFSKRKLFKKIEDEKLDVLFVLNMGKSLSRNIRHIRKIKYNKVKIVSWVHTSLTRARTNPALLNIFDCFFAISNGIAAQIKGYGFNNIVTIFNPVDKASLVKRAENHFIYVGRIDENKRLKEIIDIFSEIKSSNFIFDIYGSTGSIEKDKALLHFIQNKNFSGVVNYHGWKNDPWKHIKEASVLILNSKNEGFPLVLGEAMIRGVACLSSNCETGPSDIIQHNINGWLFDVDNQQELKKYIEGIIQGKIIIPEPSIVQKSVNKFITSNYIENFKKAMFELAK